MCIIKILLMKINYKKYKGKFVINCEILPKENIKILI